MFSVLSVFADRGNDNWLVKYEQADIVVAPIPPDPVPTQHAVKDSNVEWKAVGDDASAAHRSSPSAEHQGNVDEQPVEKLIDVDSVERPQPPTQMTMAMGMASDGGDKYGAERPIDDPITDNSDACAIAQHQSKDQCVNVEPDECIWSDVSMPTIQLAAIDNGLAFPFKHPDEWRAYPYHWAWLPIAKMPFSEETVQKVLPFVESTEFVQELCEDLRKIFKEDKGFDKKMFELQLNVMRGQIFNLREALKQRKSPQQLVQMPPQLIVEVKSKKKKRKSKESKTRAINRRNMLQQQQQQQQQLHSANEDTADGSASAGACITFATTGDESQTDRMSSPHAGDDSSGIASSAAVATSSAATSQQSRAPPKTWHEVYQQKVQTRSAFFTWW
ncbi:unnamed protein product [Anisakis simplex]|uniref:Phosphatidylinositol 4-kinase type 2 n=1 Tax=Anisakis simplex TaxID=6269 RepID=A0A0M3J4Z5_ANISI|nr:unnamed protein product [Anisakis simplex]